jgi:multidrug efflux pump subunit AcrB
MNITRYAIEKNRVTSVLLILILFGGIMAYNQLPQAEDPGFIIRTALVTTYFPGASPERIEQLVTDKLEKVIQEIPELDFVSSISKTGVSFVFTNIKESYKNMRPIWDDLRRKVEKIQNDLPEEIIGPIVNDEFGDVFGIIFTLTGEGYSYAELKEVADEVRDEMLQLPDVAKVDITGAQDERIFIEYNDAKLAELGLSPIQLKSILETQNIINPGGDIRINDSRIVLEPIGNFESVEQIKKTLISHPLSQGIVPLEDIAFVSRGYVDPPKTKVRANNIDALALSISMREGGNIVNLGKQVEDLMVRLKQSYPIGIEFDVAAFQPVHVQKKIDDFVGSLLQAIILVLLVMLVSLGIRTGLIVAILIPMTMLLTLLLMNLFGMQLDQMTLASLIIALGMLVDNAIVMSENIMVQMSEGVPAVQAAIDSATELRIPLLTSSLTTTAAFLPFFLAKSAMGEYVGVIFVVVSIALLSSWILSITMTPLICSKFLKVKQNKQRETYSSKFYNKYRGGLLFILKNRFLTIVAIIIIFILTMMASGLVPNIFLPPNDKAILTAEIELPIGTAIERTESVLKAIEQYLEQEMTVRNPAEDKTEGVINWSTYIGQGAPKFLLSYNPEQRAPAYGMMLVNCTSRAYVDTAVNLLNKFCNENFPEAIAKINPLPLGPPITDPVEIRISGKNPDKVSVYAEEVKKELNTFNMVYNIKDNWGARTQKILIKIDEARAKRSGLTNQDIAVSLQTLLSGFQTTEYREDDKVIPVVMRTVASDRENIDMIESLNIYSLQSGRAVPLKQVADAELVWQPAKILRRNRLKTVTVSAALLPGFTTVEVINKIDEWLEKKTTDWPVGYKYEYGGEIETSEKSSKSIGDQMPVAMFIIIILLVIQFNSIRKPIIILLAIPLGIIGVFLGLIVFNSYFGFMTLLGVVSLAGIVINNAIVLLERIKLEMDENAFSPQRAIVEAAQRRMRPILLTTATTICGLIPLYLGGGPMWEPMAVAIMCGLAFATLLTLGVVPVLYSLFFKVNYKGYDFEMDSKRSD